MSVGEVGEFSTSAPAFVLAGDSVHFWEINSSGGKVRTIVFKISEIHIVAYVWKITHVPALFQHIYETKIKEMFANSMAQNIWVCNFHTRLLTKTSDI